MNEYEMALDDWSGKCHEVGVALWEALLPLLRPELVAQLPTTPPDRTIEGSEGAIHLEWTEARRLYPSVDDQIAWARRKAESVERVRAAQPS